MFFSIMIAFQDVLLGPINETIVAYLVLDFVGLARTQMTVSFAKRILFITKEIANPNALLVLLPKIPFNHKPIVDPAI